ncbi:hypothetical protein NCCP1664_28040 [Zafaria cholistanensis]|uniref:Uncharacterized protein n=1 Tax=Zafaria cholistanensis TaxID=1682741 RepID=A0A5A7NUB9_9MICC|nr:hypothetical protein [Zafaria cholistanensis]GER24309.1 hypothetical protein NCCP1664_28040 [Zafaria cholistanensis]
MNTPEPPNKPGATARPEAGLRTGAGTGSGAGGGSASAALSVLEGLADLSVEDHADVYDGLHEALLQALDADADADADGRDGTGLWNPAGVNATGRNAVAGES